MSQEPKKVERRSFLNYAAAIIATGVVVGAGVYLLKPSSNTTSTQTVTSTVAGQPVTTTLTTTTTTTAAGTGVSTTTVTSTVAGTTITPEKNYTIWMADHGEVGSSFWGVCYKGVADAMTILSATGYANINFKHTYTNEDYAKQADDLKTAVASKPDGILITVPSDPTLLDATVRAGVAEGIPFICLNANDPRAASQMMPYLFYVGENAYEVGPAMGLDMSRWLKAHLPSFTPKNLLEANPTAGHFIWETRLKTYGDYFKAAWPGCVVNEQVVGTDTTKMPDVMTSLLTQYPDTNVIIGSGGELEPCYPVFTTMGKTPGKDLLIVALDSTPKIVQYIENLTCVDAFDQQPYSTGINTNANDVRILKTHIFYLWNSFYRAFRNQRVKRRLSN